MTIYRCLTCGNVWDYRGSSKPVRCGRCRSYDIIPEDEFQAIIKEARKIDEKNPALRLEILKVILKTRGLRFQPLATINLVERVLDDVFPEEVAGVYMTPNGRVYFHKVRKKKREDSHE